MHTFSFKNGTRKKGWVTRIEGDKIWVQYSDSADETWLHDAELNFPFRPASYIKSVIAAELNIPKFRIYHNGQLAFWVPAELSFDARDAIEDKLEPLNIYVSKWDRGYENTILTFSTAVP